MYIFGMIFRYVVLAGPTGESVLEVYFWMAFGNAEVVSPSIAGSKVDKVDPKMAPTQP